MVLLLIFLSACENKPASDKENVFYEIVCDAERLDESGKEMLTTVDSDVSFRGIGGRTTERARSGEYSIKVDKTHQFGFSTKLKDAEIGDRYILIGYRWSEGSEAKLIASNDDFWYAASTTGRVDERGWEEFYLEFFVPPNSESGLVNFYVWNPGEIPAYYDDIKIAKVDSEIKAKFDVPGLYLYIDQEGYAKLEAKRKKAIEDDILVTTDDSWVKAILFHGEDMLEAKVRLKGDWTDHLQGVKWSFRVKLKEGSWRGMRTFSIQNPNSRSNINEWLAHKIFEGEDVLSPRYGFVPVFLNNQNLGLYAYEEHFEKQLVESKSRREGPILKLSENQFWEGNLTGETGNLPIVESAVILPFKSSKLLQNPNLVNQFEVAQSLLYKYQFLQSPPDELFDMDRLAKYIALIDLTKGFHGVTWHNQRFYYNPIISRLEAIGYDLYVETEVSGYMKMKLLGEFEGETFFDARAGDSSIKYLLSDSTLMANYISYLEKYSAPAYMDSILKSYANEISELEEMIRQESPYYQFDHEFLPGNARFIRELLPELDATRYADMQGGKLKDKRNFNVSYFPSTPSHYVHAYRSDSTSVLMENFYPDSIRITGVQRSSGATETLPNPMSMSAYKALTLDEKELSLSVDKGDRILFEVIGHAEPHSVEIIPWASPKTYHIDRPEVRIPEELFEQDGMKLSLKIGTHQLTDYVHIPPGYEVHFPAGSSLNLIEGAFILSYSPVFLNGSAESPIIFTSSDGTGLGLNVLQAESRSQIHHVNYSGMDAFRFGKWSLSGSLNMFESDVDISNLHISDNHCEDALNIVKSDFQMSDCSFAQIFADAFDSDFSTGNLSSTSFEDVLNDAIDFSGSVVNISHCTMDRIGDKGVSGGEGSTLTVSNVKVRHAAIGIASKDRSRLITDSCAISDCDYGLVVFQKKPEYGPAYVDAQHLTWTKVKEPFLIEKGSSVKMNEKVILGKAKKVAEIFY